MVYPESSQTIPVGDVVTQMPVPGSPMIQGSTVILYVSTGNSTP